MKNVYLIFGNQEFLINEKKDEIVKKIQSLEKIEVRKYYCGDIEQKQSKNGMDTANEISENLFTQALFSEKKLIILERAEYLKVKADEKKIQKTSQTGKIIASLKKYLESSEKNNLLLITACVRKLTDLPKAVFEQLKTNPDVEILKTLITYEDYNPTKWIQKKCSDLNFFLSEEAAAFLTDIAGNDLMMIDSELRKIEKYLGNEKREEISYEELKKIISHSKTFNNFQLISYICEKNLLRVTECLDYLLHVKNEEVIGIFAILTFQFRQLLKISWMLNCKKSNQEIQKATKIHANFLGKKIREANNFTAKELENIMLAVSRMDTELKTLGKEAPRFLKNFCFLIVKGSFRDLNGIREKELL